MSQDHDAFSDENNPYRATSTEAASYLHADNAFEAIRRAHISHEASVKSIGILYTLSSILCLIGSLSAVIAIFRVGGGGGFQERLILIGVVSLYVCLGAFLGLTASSLWKLEPWTRWVTVIFSALGLLAFPVGSLISGYFLYLLLSQKGAMIFSAPYKEVIDKTPHIQYKTSMIVWVLLWILVAVIAVGIGILFFSGV